MTNGFVWDIDPENAFGELADAYIEAVRVGIHTVFLAYEEVVRNWMVANAPWRDRTGNARQTLWSKANREGDVISLEFGHGVWYGFYLETSYAGVYAIVTPALDQFSQPIWEDIRGLFK